MFDLIDDDLFADTVSEIFSVLLPSYVEDLCKELLPRLRATFDGAYETRFVVISNETGEPITRNAVLEKRDTAEEFCRILGADKHSVGLLLIER